MKGLEREYLIGLLMVIIVFVVGLLVFTGFWKIGIPVINDDKDIRGECGKWLSTEPSCVVAEKPGNTFDGYPSLKKTYFTEDMLKETDSGKKATEIGSAIASAKSFCGCIN
jgi:hypothetical protein